MLKNKSRRRDAAPPAGVGGTELSPFANGSNTSRNTSSSTVLDGIVIRRAVEPGNLG